jgi:Ala-tRNA(Pro) deacylase
MENGGAAMECREQLESYLRQNGVAFETRHHPRAFTAQEVSELEHIPGKLMAKVVIVIADDKKVMLVLPAPWRVDLDRVASALGAQAARLAREEEFVAAFPDCELGAMPPFGNLYRLPVYVERSLAEDPTIYFAAGTHTDTMGVSYSDFARLVRPTVTAFGHPG